MSEKHVEQDPAFGVYKRKSMRSLYGGRRKGQISEHRAGLVRGKSTDGLSTPNHLCCANAQYWYWYWYLEHDEISILIFNVSEFFREHTQNSFRGHSENTLWSVPSFAGLQG